MAEHDDETVRIGRENIARIRAQLGNLDSPSSKSSDPSSCPETTRTPRVPESGDREINQIRLDMAFADEREQLLATVHHQAGRIAQLESTLAAVIRAAAGGVETDSSDRAALRSKPS